MVEIGGEIVVNGNSEKLKPWRIGIKRMLDKMKRLYELGEKGRPDVVQMESQVAPININFFITLLFC